jgi:hypothetical protein
MLKGLLFRSVGLIGFTGENHPRAVLLGSKRCWPTIDASDPVDLLNDAIDELGHSQPELADLPGSRSRAFEALDCCGPLTVEMIQDQRSLEDPARSSGEPSRLIARACRADVRRSRHSPLTLSLRDHRHRQTSRDRYGRNARYPFRHEYDQDDGYQYQLVHCRLQKISLQAHLVLNEAGPRPRGTEG